MHATLNHCKPATRRHSLSERQIPHIKADCMSNHHLHVHTQVPVRLQSRDSKLLPGSCISGTRMQAVASITAIAACTQLPILYRWSPTHQPSAARRQRRERLSMARWPDWIPIILVVAHKLMYIGNLKLVLLGWQAT